MKAAELFDVTRHVAFVTSAASGLGLAMAEAMADNGAHVDMADIDPATLAVQTGRLAGAGASVEGIELDVADLPALRAAIDATAEKRGRLDAVFANAGISAGPGYLTEAGKIDAVDPAKWDEVVHINLTSVFATVQAAARHMKRQKSGHIVVTASIAGLKAEPMVGYAYNGTKTAVVGLVRQAALELAPTTSRSTPSRPGRSSPTSATAASTIRKSSGVSPTSSRWAGLPTHRNCRAWRCCSPRPPAPSSPEPPFRSTAAAWRADPAPSAALPDRQPELRPPPCPD